MLALISLLYLNHSIQCKSFQSILLNQYYSTSTSSFSTYFIYRFLKSFLSILLPETKSTAFRINDMPRHRQLIINKNEDSRWKPYKWFYDVSRIAPIIRGKTPNAKFCIISIRPNAVPKSLGFTIIGRVGIITVQNNAMPIPIKVTGTQRIHYYFLSY